MFSAGSAPPAAVFKRADNGDVGDPLKDELDSALSDLSAWAERNVLSTHSDHNQGFSPEGLKRRDEMIARGYDPRTIVPIHGLPVFDRDKAEELFSFKSFPLVPKKEE